MTSFMSEKIFMSEHGVADFFGETALQTRSYFRRGGRKAAGIISTEKRKQP